MRNVFFILCSSFSLVASAQTQKVEVVEFHPAPGQFVNALPLCEEETTHKAMCEACTENLNDGTVVSLGTYGGYITMKLEEPIENTIGSDFRIYGNGYYQAGGTNKLAGSFEPGIVYVGVGETPESAEWYELAGSEYYTTEIHDFSITYYKPTAESGEHKLPFSTYDNYIRFSATWTENGEKRDSSGYLMKNSFHKQSYYPLFEDKDSLVFKGGKLPNNAIQSGSNWLQLRYSADSYGYVDASLNSDDYSTFDIDWAVDGEGKKVNLERVDFVRVVCGTFQTCGWLGETSTEVAGIENLHLIPGYDDNPIILTEKNSKVDVVVDREEQDESIQMYIDLNGKATLNPTTGVYFYKGKKVLIRK